MKNEHIKTHLINAGIRNLKEFGYEAVDKENIITDVIYSGFFESMLKEQKR